MKVPRRLAPVLTGFLLSGFMSLIVSFVATVRTAEAGTWSIGLWGGAWLSSWIVAFPAVLIVAPLVRRLVGKVVERD